MKYKLLSSIVLMAGLMTGHHAEAKEPEQPRIYSIIIDRYMNGSEKNNSHIHNEKNDQLPYGGDFQGIKSKLDYIKDMGFNTIQLSPVFEHETNDYAGYRVTSYDKIAAVYGGEKEFKSLINAAHHKHMKVIVDMPVTATNEFTQAVRPVMNKTEEKYYNGTSIIDLTNPANQSLYKEKMTDFTDKYDVDGLSMYVLQNGIDAKTIFPKNTMTIGILNKGIQTQNFTYIQKEETTLKLANAFKTTDQPIPGEYADNELLAADQFFMPRFTHYAAEENMFPGTRIKQLMSYLMIQQRPISMNYGTEIAMNGQTLPESMQLMDFRTEKEVTDYLEDTSKVYDKYKEMNNGTVKVIENNKGNQVLFFDTDDVDFVYNINNTSKATNVKLSEPLIPNNKMLSGLLIGDAVHQKDGGYHLITNREEAELYAVVPARGLNISYIVAAASIIILFTAFILTVARRSKRNKIRD